MTAHERMKAAAEQVIESHVEKWVAPAVLADEIVHAITATWDWPRVVTTEAELDALPLGSLVLDGGGDVYERVDRPRTREYRFAQLRRTGYDDEQLERTSTVLWQGYDGPRALVLWIPEGA